MRVVEPGMLETEMLMGGILTPFEMFTVEGLSTDGDIAATLSVGLLVAAILGLLLNGHIMLCGS